MAEAQTGSARASDHERAQRLGATSVHKHAGTLSEKAWETLGLFEAVREQAALSRSSAQSKKRIVTAQRAVWLTPLAVRSCTSFPETQMRQVAEPPVKL